MTLSAYLVNSIYKKNFRSMTFMDIIEESRKYTRIWWLENRDITRLAEQNFELFTGLSFTDHADDVKDGYADHYAEKIYGSGHVTEEFVELLDKIKFINRDKRLLQEQLKNNTVLCMTSHFGGVDFLPACLSQNGLPTSVFLRFKSTLARESAFEQMKKLNQWFDFKLLDADGSLAREMHNMAKKPRLLVTVADAFKHWRRDRKDRQEIDFLGHSVGLDNTPHKLSRLFKAPVYFLIMHRIVPGEYEISLESVEPDENGYSMPIFNKWRKLITEHPAQWYAWEELHWSWTMDPRSPDYNPDAL